MIHIEPAVFKCLFNQRQIKDIRIFSSTQSNDNGLRKMALKKLLCKPSRQRREAQGCSSPWYFQSKGKQEASSLGLGLRSNF
jgi:hypothetical protein